MKMKLNIKREPRCELIQLLQKEYHLRIMEEDQNIEESQEDNKTESPQKEVNETISQEQTTFETIQTYPKLKN